MSLKSIGARVFQQCNHGLPRLTSVRTEGVVDFIPLAKVNNWSPLVQVTIDRLYTYGNTSAGCQRNQAYLLGHQSGCQQQ